MRRRVTRKLCEAAALAAGVKNDEEQGRPVSGLLATGHPVIEALVGSGKPIVPRRSKGRGHRAKLPERWDGRRSSETKAEAPKQLHHAAHPLTNRTEQLGAKERK